MLLADQWAQWPWARLLDKDIFMPTGHLQFAPAGYQYNSMLPNILEGLQGGQRFRQSQQMFPQQMQQAQLANALAQIKNQYAEPQLQAELQAQQLQNQFYPEKAKADIEQSLAAAMLNRSSAQQNQFKMNSPWLYGGEEARTIGALKELGLLGNTPQQGQPMQPGMMQPEATQGDMGVQMPQPMGRQGQDYSNVMAPMGASQRQSSMTPFQTGNPVVDAILNKPFASQGYQQELVKNWNWSQLPADAKRGMVAQGAALGVEPSELMRRIKEGQNLRDIAGEKGFDPDNMPPPNYYPTQALTTQNLKAIQADAELDAMGSMATANIKPYAETFLGYSPSQIIDSLSGQNDEQLGKYIAGLTVQQEIANVRNRIAGGESGITAVHDLMERSMNAPKTLFPHLSAEAYEVAQHEINRIVKQALKARNLAGTNPLSPDYYGEEAASKVMGKSSVKGSEADPLGLR